MVFKNKWYIFDLTWRIKASLQTQCCTEIFTLKCQNSREKAAREVLQIMITSQWKGLWLKKAHRGGKSAQSVKDQIVHMEAPNPFRCPRFIWTISTPWKPPWIWPTIIGQTSEEDDIRTFLFLDFFSLKSRNDFNSNK